MCLTHRHLIVSACIYACQSSDTWDIRDILDINDSGSLTSLNLVKNFIFADEYGAGAMPALANALKKTTNLTSLDISKNFMRPVQAAILAPALQGMGSLSSLTLNYGGGRAKDNYGDWQEGDPVTIDTTMTEADLSGENLGIAGAQILAAFISTKHFKTKGALAKLTINEYALPIQELNTSTELDCSGKGLNCFDLIIVVSCIQVQNHLVCIHNHSMHLFPIKDAHTLASLNLSNNDLGVEGARHIASALQVRKSTA
jgi:hypothetical protein